MNLSSPGCKSPRRRSGELWVVSFVAAQASSQKLWIELVDEPLDAVPTSLFFAYLARLAISVAVKARL